MKFPKLKAQYGVMQTPTQPYNILGGIEQFVPGQLEGDGFRFTTGQKHPYFTPMPDESQFTTEIHGGGGDPGYTLDEKQFIVTPEQTDKPLSFSDSRVVDKGSGAMLGQPPITFPFSGSQNIPMVGNVQYKGEAPMPDIGPDDLTQEQYDAFDPNQNTTQPLDFRIDEVNRAKALGSNIQDPYSNWVDEYEKKMKDIGKGYFANQRAYGVSSLIHNILQPEPPSRVSKNVYLDRFRMDERPFKVAAAQQQEMATKANAASRRIGQLSDAMKFQQASQATSQEQARGLATAFSQAVQQVRGMNTQTAQKQDMVNTEIINRDIDFNLRQKDAHHKHKADAISKSLAMLSQTEGHQARFAADTAHAVSQHRVMEQHRKDQAKLNLAAMKLQHSKGFDETERYTSELSKKKIQFFKDKEQEIRDAGYIPYIGKLDNLETDLTTREEKNREMIASLEETKQEEPKKYAAGADQATIDAYNDAYATWKDADDKYTTDMTSLTATQQALVTERNEFDKKKTGKAMFEKMYGESDIEKEFREEYKKKYGYYDYIDVAPYFPSLYQDIY